MPSALCAPGWRWPVPKLAASETLPPASARHWACRRRRSHRHGRGARAIRRRRDAEPRRPAASVGRAGRGRHRGGHTPAGWRSLRMPRSRAATDRRVCGAAARLARRQGKRCHKPLRGAALYGDAACRARRRDRPAAAALATGAASATFALNAALCLFRVRFMSCSCAHRRFLGRAPP
jgi:hypothetical protein